MDRQEVIEMLEKIPFAELKSMAAAVLESHKGKRVLVRGLIEFSNVCRRNCAYCGLRAQNRGLTRYTLSREQILGAAREAVARGADTIVLQSGEGAIEAPWLASIVDAICGELKVPVTLSVGEQTEYTYAMWREAGAKRYLLRHETANPGLYSALHKGYSLEGRIHCLKVLKKLGYETGGGFICGLPGQGIADIADDLLLCRELELDMAGIGPFIAQKDTPLAGQPAGKIDLALRALAILRLLLPCANLPATTALATLDPQSGQTRAFLAGANVIMPNFTPMEHGRNYNIYDAKKRVDVNGACAEIEAAGRSHGLVRNS